MAEHIAILETENHDMKEAIAQIEKMAYEQGYHLKQNPFIPEYLGFEETVLTANDMVHGRIYTKKGFNVARPVSVDQKGWIVLTSDGKKFENILLENMYNAIVVLRALGMDISVQDYFDHNKKELDRMAERGN